MQANQEPAPQSVLDGPNSSGATTAQAATSRAAAKVPVTLPALLTDHQAAAMWGLGVSKFHELRASSPPWFPKPIQLSGRIVRYARAEVEEAVLAMPRQEAVNEPSSLRRARIARMKGGAAK